MKLKIGIMGAHGAGKTTYAKKIAKKLLPLNRKTTVIAQMWLYHCQMTREIEMASIFDILVCDRTTLDTVVYAQHAGFGEFVGKYLYTSLEWLDTYDFLYWMQPAFTPVADGFRDTDPAFQDAIDAIFMDIRIWYRRAKTVAGIAA